MLLEQMLKCNMIFNDISIISQICVDSVVIVKVYVFYLIVIIEGVRNIRIIEIPMLVVNVLKMGLISNKTLIGGFIVIIWF